jgi:hypothetical protein
VRGFWIDSEYDRDHAGRDATSRYARQVRAAAGVFADLVDDISPVRFAQFAWLLATPPALDPGFVRWHRRVLSASCMRNTWDGGLSARVEIASPWPAELTWSKQWWHDRGWRDWPEVFGQFVEPADRDVVRAPHLLTTLTASVPVPLTELPPAPRNLGPELEPLAAHAVRVIVRELNDLLEPVLTQLDGSVPDGPPTPEATH